ncbi:hydroxyphenylacetyl-CoA thioesterase PaaI [Pseudocolwellia sp. HL-MZ19]|uniref:hydroxyphenylacetyl-CoA thioesterase PaaI n=1 Tax=Pseudocolwellia sp. HL-MZ19 TaxID=3400846 RepID=UPI003CF36D4B
MTISNNQQNAQLLAKQCAEHMLNNDSVSKNLGIKIESMDCGQSRVSMTVTHNMLNGHKTCHGGMIFSFADSAFAFACNSENEAAVAASCSIDFLLPAYENDKLTATANNSHQGKRTGIYQVAITNQNNQLIALFKGNSARIRRNVLPDNKPIA